MSEALKRRDWFVGQAAKSAKDAGREVDAEVIARQAARDLDVLDRAVATGAIASKKEEKSAEEKSALRAEARQRSSIDNKAAELNAKLWEKAVANEPAPILKPPTGVEMERLIAMDKRIRILCKPIPGYRLKRGEPLGNACEYPRFANLLFNHSTGFARGIFSYKGLNYEDRQRKYLVEVEKICNQSDAVIGFNWWAR